MSHFRPPPTEESPHALPLGQGIAVHGSGPSKYAAVKDAMKTYGEDEPKPVTHADPEE